MKAIIRYRGGRDPRGFSAEFVKPWPGVEALYGDIKSDEGAEE